MTLAERAYHDLKTMVITEALPPAAPVDKQQLMTQLGIGQAPLRDALQRLAFEKLVVISPRRGTFVADLSLIQLQQAFDARLLIERHTASLAATKITSQQIKALQDLHRETDQIADDEDLLTAIAIDQTFHRMIADIGANEFLRDFLDTLMPITMRLWYYVHSRAKDPAATIHEAGRGHFAIIDALATGQPDAAEEAMANHILHFRDRAFDQIMNGNR
jgi:DNA-binding GntR family transcriptional regulator